MTRDELVRSAGAIAPPDSEAAAEYARAGEALAARISAELGARPDLAALIGPDGRGMMEQNHRNHARFMASLLAAFSPEVLVDTVLWVFRAYRSHGFALAYWPAQLDAWLTALPELLPPRAAEQVRPIYEWMLVNQPAFAALSDEALARPPL